MAKLERKTTKTEAKKALKELKEEHDEAFDEPRHLVNTSQSVGVRTENKAIHRWLKEHYSLNSPEENIEKRKSKSLGTEEKDTGEETKSAIETILTKKPKIDKEHTTTPNPELLSKALEIIEIMNSTTKTTDHFPSQQVSPPDEKQAQKHDIGVKVPDNDYPLTLQNTRKDTEIIVVSRV